MIIGVPSAIKTFNWLGTIYKGNIHYTAAMMNALAFVAMFVIGGLSGIFMASTLVDMYIHDTIFLRRPHPLRAVRRQPVRVLRRHHLLVSQDVRPHDERDLAKIHFWISFIAFNCTFFPMHILGMNGHMRRIYNPLHTIF